MKNIIAKIASSHVQAVIQLIEKDFGITIAEDAALAIRQAAKYGNLIYTETEIRVIQKPPFAIIKAANGYVSSHIPFTYTRKS